MTELTQKGNTACDSKIKITRLTESNITNNGILKASTRLAKAHNILK